MRSMCRRLGATVIVFVAGCGDGGGGAPDLAAGVDLALGRDFATASADLATANDLATAPDLAVESDLATPDLAAEPDLTMPDLAVAPDLATPDLVVVPDLVAPADLTVGKADLAALPDLVALADLTAPKPDLAMPPDLAIAPDLAKPVDLAVPPPDLAKPDLTVVGPQTVDVAVGQGGLAFVPKTLNIKVGDTVRWTWVGGNHTVTSGGGGGNPTPDNKFCNPNNMNCANAPVVGAGTVYQFKFTQAGTYPYYCSPHFFAGMTGTINVQ